MKFESHLNSNYSRDISVGKITWVNVGVCGFLWVGDMEVR